MAIDALSSTLASQNPSKAELGDQKIASSFDEFLHLLITQLKNQDPTEPLDTAQFTNQLVMFSQVQQSVDMNLNMEHLIAATQANQINQSVSYIGKTVDAEGNQANLFDGYAEFSYKLPEDAKSVTVSISNDQGVVVFSGDGTKKAGKNVVTWDGTNSITGQKMKNGIYTITVKAKTLKDEDMKDVATYTTGVVTSVDMEEGKTYLSMQTLKVPLEKVVSVRESVVLVPDDEESNNTQG